MQPPGKTSKLRLWPLWIAACAGVGLLCGGKFPAFEEEASAALLDESNAIDSMLLGYLVECALPDGARLRTPSGGSYPGKLGFAADWLRRGLSIGEQRLLSACVLARMNPDGRQVQILLDRPTQMPAAASLGPEHAQAVAARLRLEGAFFGDIFAQPPHLYACAGDLEPDRSAWLSSHARECTESAEWNQSTNRCGFELKGLCTRAIFVQQGIDYFPHAIFVHLPRAFGAPEPSSARP